MSAAVLAYVVAILQALPSILQAGVTIEQFVTSTIASLQAMQHENRDPTAAEWQALNATLLAALAQLSKAAG